MKQQEYFMKCQELLDYMESLHYSPATIVNIKKMIARIDRHVKRHSAPQYKLFRKTLSYNCNLHNLDIVYNYVIHDIKPVPYKRERKWEQKANNISGEMKDLIVFFLSNAQEYSPKTVTMRHLCLTKFFYFLQSRGIYQLSDITENDVYDFYQNNVMAKGTCKHLRAGLLMAKSFNTVAIQRLINLLPMFPYVVRPKQTLTLQESQLIYATLVDESNRLSLRDRAIGLLAFYTGLRITDIAKLNQDAIHWDEQQIVLQQSKTGKWLTLELRPIVGNAIYRYIHEERPKGTHLGQVFLSETFNVTAIQARHVANVGKKLYKLAGVRQDGGRKGLHIFRHSLVNQLIDIDTDAAIISSLLGHQSPRSLEDYLASNEKKLSQFALDISCYPIN